MKIDSVGVSKLLNKYNKENNKTKRTESDSKQDSFKISENAQQMQRAKAEVDKVSETRQKRVESLKQKVDEGNYNVSGEKIAEKMLNQARLNKLV